MSIGPAPPGGTPAAGYYPDPNTGVPRYWDGAQWRGFAPPASNPGPRVATPAGVGTSGFAIAALVLGLMWGYGIGSILAIVFGVIGRKQCDRGEKTGRGIATAGLVLGIIGVVIIGIVLIAAIGASSSAGGLDTSN